MKSWHGLMLGYLDDLKARGRSPRTLEAMSQWLERWKTFCRAEGVECPTDLTPAHLAAYRLRLEHGRGCYGKPFAPATIDLALRAVRALLGFACERGELLVNPAAGLVLRRPVVQRRRILNVQEMEFLLQLPDPRRPIGLRDRAMWEVLYGAGLRSSECCALDLADLDFAQRALLVRRGKGGKDRLLPMGEAVREACERYLEAGRPKLADPDSPPALFLNRDGTRITPKTLQERLAIYLEQAWLPGARPTVHSLRHSCASHLLEGGADLLEIREFLGHADIRSTQIYTHLVPLDLMAEHRRTHPRAEGGERARMEGDEPENE
ncbi:site-specific tyrosine recombinase XerD [bacterium CPR1]|nr:site-specific tyrosine recombinase XerD [bacterium CPR1]